MRSGGRYSGRFATTVDYVAKKARIDRGDKADLIDNEGFEGRPTIRRALATLGTIEGYAVGGCCDLSTSTHHLVQRLGVNRDTTWPRNQAEIWRKELRAQPPD